MSNGKCKSAQSDHSAQSFQREGTKDSISCWTQTLPENGDPNLSTSGHFLKKLVPGLHFDQAIPAKLLDEGGGDFKRHHMLDDDRRRRNSAHVAPLVAGSVRHLVRHADRIQRLSQRADWFFRGTQDQALAIGHATF